MTIRIWIYGSNRADVATILNKIKTGEWFPDITSSIEENGESIQIKYLIPDTTPTIGMNAETIQIGDITFSAWDLGGQLQFRRALWEMYTKNSNGIIYVIDLSDPARFPESRNYLWRILRMNHFKNIPLAIFANKVDLVDCTEEDLDISMGINNKMSRTIKTFRTNVLTGEGIREGIFWLIDTITKSKL